MRRKLLLFSCLCLLFSCYKNTQEEACSRYYDDGRAKPVVAIASTIDSTTYDVPWNLSEEITALIRQQIAKKRNSYLPSQEDIDRQINFTNNPFDADISWVKNHFQNFEFLVFVELLEHKNLVDQNAEKYFLSPYYQSSSTNLISTTRIRVIDVRGKEPRIILQETIKDSYFIPKNPLHINYEKNCWGTQDYLSTPLATAHEQLTKKIAHRVEDYIMIAKSR